MLPEKTGFDQKRVKLWCAVSFVFGASTMLLITSIITILLVYHFHGGRLPRHLSSNAVRPEKIPPSGRVDAIEIPLANPDGHFPDSTERLAQPQWFFEAFSEQRLTRFLSSCDLRTVERNALLDKRSWEFRTNGILVSPPEQLLWSLSHSSRQQIYSTLAKSPINYSQRFPFRFPPGGLSLKFQNSGLPVEQVERIRRLSYTNGGYICFTDLRAMQQLLKPEEFKDLIETLYAVPTYMLRLQVNPDSDIAALVRYWGRGGREKLIAPIINAVGRMPGGGAINISYLMPPFARLHLYTFPEDWKDPSASRQDCFFTAMNFFNETPNTNFFDANYSRKILDAEYEPIHDEPAFGDLVTLFNETGEAVHACVYIADDFVFTKNGINSAQPWVLMRMSDMLVIYLAPEHSGKLLFLRRKGTS